MDSALLIVVILAIVAGVAIGWFLGSRPVAEWRARHDLRDGEAKAHEGTVKAMTVDLAAMSERVKALDALSAELAAVRDHRDQLAPALATARQQAADAELVRAELAQARADREALRTALERMKADAENFAEQKRLLIEAQEALRKEFENAGNKVLEKAQETFLLRAQARFEESEKSSAERLKTLLSPVDQRLKAYEEQVGKLEKDRIDAFGNLTGLIHSMRDGQEAVRAAAAQLGNSLRNGPKTRGRWGELQLRNVLEQCGLAEHTDFVTEHSVDTDEGRLRPDAIVRVPGNKLLVIDAKVSLNAYQEATETSDESVRDVLMDQHVASMRNHIQTLSSKSYQSQFSDAPDYVIMFVPGEHFISAAMEHDAKKHATSLKDDSLLRKKDLWNYAFDQRVLLASPTNLVAIARTVAQVWRQDGLAQEAKEIGKLGSELYDRIAKVAEDITKVGTHLSRAVGSYNEFARSFESRVAATGKKLRDKHIEVGKREISEIPLIESVPIYADAEPAALAAIANDEGETGT